MRMKKLVSGTDISTLHGDLGQEFAGILLGILYKLRNAPVGGGVRADMTQNDGGGSILANYCHRLPKPKQKQTDLKLLRFLSIFSTILFFPGHKLYSAMSAKKVSNSSELSLTLNILCEISCMR